MIIPNIPDEDRVAMAVYQLSRGIEMGDGVCSNGEIQLGFWEVLMRILRPRI